MRYIADKVFGSRERQFQAYIEATVNVCEYDAVFCSSCYFFPLQTVHRLARKYHKPFLIDLRDISEQWGNIPYNTHSVASSRMLNRWFHRCYTAVHVRQRNRVLAAANQVITISPWHQQVLSRINPSTALIYNGFDEQEFYPRDIQTDRFVISYAGKIYNLLFRDPRLLFAAMRQLIDSGRIDPSLVTIQFHIDPLSISPLHRMIDEYGLTDICHVDGYIPRNELLPLLHRSSVLLVLTCQSTPDGAHGIMGTKFYEAMGVEKPVLCIRSDEECLAQVIEQTHAGLAGKEVQEVADFLLDKYHEWQQNGFTRQALQHKDLFAREAQSRQIENLIISHLS